MWSNLPLVKKIAYLDSMPVKSYTKVPGKVERHLLEHLLDVLPPSLRCTVELYVRRRGQQPGEDLNDHSCSGDDQRYPQETHCNA